MFFNDFVKLTATSLLAHKLRSALTLSGIAVGIAAVVMLTSIGEGVRRYVLSEFTQFGTTIIAINPGKTTTAGMSVGMFGSTRPLTIADAEALQRITHVNSVVPFVMGNAEIKGNNRRRRTTIYGVGSAFPEAFKMGIASGKFLPADDPDAPRAFAVLGHKVKQELFGNKNPLGSRIRIASDRYRVIGVMQSKGTVLGFDLDDTVYIPAARALGMFNRDSLIEIDVLYEENARVDRVVNNIKRILAARHGREDFTITTQQQMLDTMGSILNVLTLAVGAIGGISLFVGAIGIVTIMTISVNERISEVGVLRAIGAQQRHILALFLGEAVVLSAVGGVLGLVIGILISQLIQFFIPALPVYTPWHYVVIAEVLAIIIGLLAGVIPAQRAARLDPVEALRSE